MNIQCSVSLNFQSEDGLPVNLFHASWKWDTGLSAIERAGNDGLMTVYEELCCCKDMGKNHTQLLIISWEGLLEGNFSQNPSLKKCESHIALLLRSSYFRVTLETHEQVTLCSKIYNYLMIHLILLNCPSNSSSP